MGLISDEKELNLPNKQYEIGKEVLSKGCKTTLYGYFDNPTEYVGVLDKKFMVFYLGEESDLFGSKHYFKAILYLSERRIFVLFKEGSGRDFLLKDGQWK
jgi:hypothetical protein